MAELVEKYLQPLDTCLGGGIPCGSLTEIVGPAGLGKSQLCLTLTAAVLLHALKKDLPEVSSASSCIRCWSPTPLIASRFVMVGMQRH